MRLRFINILLCCLVLASCSDDTPELPVPVPEQPDLVKLTLRLPGFKTASTDLVSVTEGFSISREASDAFPKNTMS